MENALLKVCCTCKNNLELTYFSKNKSMKDGLQTSCKSCRNEINRQYRLKYPEKASQSVLNSINKNPEKYRKIKKEWYDANPNYNEKYYIENREEIKKKVRKYAETNSCKSNALKAKYRACKLKATPSWLTKEDLEHIQDFYTACRAFRLFTGLTYHVDHIVPLNGKTVCGLHVPWNLQILEASENMKKSNKL